MQQMHLNLSSLAHMKWETELEANFSGRSWSGFMFLYLNPPFIYVFFSDLQPALCDAQLHITNLKVKTHGKENTGEAAYSKTGKK